MTGIAKQDEKFMQLAIEQSKIAEENGDVPIGAVIVHEGTVIAKAYNQAQEHTNYYKFLHSTSPS